MPIDDITRCRFNRNITCLDPSECDHCGWDPEVAEARLARIKAGMKQNRDKMTIVLLRSSLPDTEIIHRLRDIWRYERYVNR